MQPDADFISWRPAYFFSLLMCFGYLTLLEGIGLHLIARGPFWVTITAFVSNAVLIWGWLGLHCRLLRYGVNVEEKILLIDDDPDTLEFLTLILGRQGYKLLTARDGIQALTQAHEQNPDLIVLDVMMPGLDGYEVARSLRRHPETALTPILMFTAKSQVEDKLAGYEAGVDIYLTKPVHPVELQANIKALLTQKKNRTDLLAKRGYVAGVVAPKGGLGVSTVALNLAITYQQKHNTKVIAAEMRPGQGSWAQELDFTNPVGLANLLRRNIAEITPAAVEDQLVSTTYGVRLLLASDNSKDLEFISASAQYEAIVEQLAGLVPLVLLDIGTNFHPAYEALVGMCNEIILVTEPQPIALKRTHLLIEELRERSFGSGKALTVVTVNRTRSDVTLSVSQIEDALKTPVALGFPPATELAYAAANRAAPLSLVQPEGIIAQQFTMLANNLSRHISSGGD
jgi:DNA-binding response OmpR family regulator